MSLFLAGFIAACGGAVLDAKTISVPAEITTTGAKTTTSTSATTTFNLGFSYRIRKPLPRESVGSSHNVERPVMCAVPLTRGITAWWMPTSLRAR